MNMEALELSSKNINPRWPPMFIKQKSKDTYLKPQGPSPPLPSEVDATIISK